MKVRVVVGSTRRERRTDRLAKWVADEAGKVAGNEVKTLDLADYPMPFFDEPISPRFNPQRTLHGVVEKWLSELEAADAYIIVTPEYNHSITGVLKNALDYIDWQFVKKPVAIVSHGSVGGARAAEHLKNVVNEVRAIVIPTCLTFMGKVDEAISKDGELSAELTTMPYGPQETLGRVLSELRWYSDALSVARTKNSSIKVSLA